jgi:NADH dehydrogenase FAD-containing subunit
MLDRVSGLFGHYPKSAQIAVRQGRIVAGQIAAQSRGAGVDPELPDSLCHIATGYAPPAAIRIAANFRRRGDGELVMQQKTERDAQPRGEDIVWLQSLYREFLPD